jgi:hypothetical protein
MSASTVTNGRPRRQLSEQLDRLDGILDLLAEGLPGAVTDACREGAQAAVKSAILEVLTNPELRALIAPVQPAPVPVAHPPEPVPEPSKPSPWERLRALLALARNAVTRPVKSAKDAVASRCKAARDAIAAVGVATGEAIPARRILLVGLGVGVAVGLASLLVPQTVAAAVSATTTTATAVVVQTGSWLTRAARRISLLS